MKIALQIPALMWVAVSLLLGLQPSVAMSGEVGMRQISAGSKERGMALSVTVWYPGAANGTMVTLGENAFFRGTAALQDAPVLPGRYPLIVLSHGAGLAGTPEALSWMAVALAGHGYVVAAPGHPGNGGANRSAAETMKLWLRPGDISATIDAMEQAPVFKDHVVPGKTGMLGLSMGGNTALAVAGARLDPERIADYCDTNTLNASLCGWVRSSGVDLHRMDLSSAGRDARDRRIRFAMAIDPAPVDVFDAASFADIAIPFDVVNLGQPGKIPPTVDAAAIARSMPQARYATIGDASHFSLFAECRQDVSETVIAEEIGDPVCSDGGGRSRGEIHAEMIDRVTAAFDRSLKAGL